MKGLKIVFILCILAAIAILSFAGTGTWQEDDVVGIYYNQEKTAKIKVFLAMNDKYSGKIVWLKEPNDKNGHPKKDPNNPNKAKRDRNRIGMVILKSFVFNKSDQKWEDGTVYDPNNGKTYNGYMKFEGNDKNTLYLRGYISGMTWLGRTAEWERIK